MQWIKEAFTPAAMANNVLIVNDLSPDDVVLHRVQQALASDALLSDMFQDRIEAVAVLDPWDFRTMPRLRVSLFSRDPVEAPTQLVIDTVNVLVEVRYEQALVRHLELGEPGLGTLFRHISGVLRDKDNRLLPMSVKGQRVPLAMESRMLGLSFRPDRDPVSGKVAYNSVMEWQYRIDVDRDTLKIANVMAAGG
jgi:hypothetical protein